MMVLLLLPAPPAAARELVRGDPSTGGDSGGEFNPVLQVVLLSVRSPVKTNFTFNHLQPKGNSIIGYN